MMTATMSNINFQHQQATAPKTQKITQKTVNEFLPPPKQKKKKNT